MYDVPNSVRVFIMAFHVSPKYISRWLTNIHVYNLELPVSLQVVPEVLSSPDQPSLGPESMLLTGWGITLLTGIISTIPSLV